MSHPAPIPTRTARFALPALAFALLLSACAPLESILYEPPQTTQTWLTTQPYFEFKLGAQNIYLMQPSTTFFVYLLGLLAIALGLHFLSKRTNQRSRMWWGIAMLLWGLGALLAGTSYEAFSYAIKCAGRPACIWTSWWEILYLLSTVWSFDALVLAAAFSTPNGLLRRIMLVYGLLNALAYTIFLLAGSLLPVKAWISFEMLILWAVPGILLCFGVSAQRFTKTRHALDRNLMGTWLWLGLTTGAYFLYYLSGLTGWLWERGLWFSENDVLHIFLIVWMLYIWRAVAPQVQDAN